MIAKLAAIVILVLLMASAVSAMEERDGWKFEQLRTTDGVLQVIIHPSMRDHFFVKSIFTSGDNLVFTANNVDGKGRIVVSFCTLKPNEAPSPFETLNPRVFSSDALSAFYRVPYPKRSADNDKEAAVIWWTGQKMKGD